MDDPSAAVQPAQLPHRQPLPPANEELQRVSARIRDDAYQASRNWLVLANEAVQQHQAVQDSHELAVALAIAETIRPHAYLEIGCHAGGTAWAFSQLPSVGLVIAVDRDPQPAALPTLDAIQAEAHLLVRDSRRSATIVAIDAVLGDRQADLLFIDGGHDYETVANDWDSYRQLVRPGGLVMLHDITPHRDHPEVEVHRLWDQLADRYQVTELVSNPGEWAGIGIVWV